MSKELEALREYWDDYQKRTAITQTIASKELGITQASLSQYLNGQMKPNTIFILKISRLMGINPSSIRPSLSCFFGSKKGKRLFDLLDKSIKALQE